MAKKARLFFYLFLMAFAHLLNLTNVFSQNVLIVLELSYCILIIVNLLSTPSVDPFKHIAIFLRCLSTFLTLHIDPSNHQVSFTSTIISGFFIGTEIDENTYVLLYSLFSLSPWLVVIIFNNRHNLSLQQAEDLTRAAYSVMFLFIFVCVSSVMSRRARLDALNKLEQAYSELRDMNSKNEEMNRHLKHLLEEKDNFILLFSHETRNPLNILLGNLTLLLEQVEAPQLRPKLLRSKFCADLLLHHLNNILDTGKLTNKSTLEVTPIRVQTREYLQSVWDFMDMLLKKKGLMPKLLVSRDIPKFLMFDPQRLTQILLNLINNAAKFTSFGSVSLNVSYLSKAQIDEADFLPETVFGNRLSRPDKGDSDNAENLEEISLITQNCHESELKRCVIQSSMEYPLSNEHLGNKKGYLKFEINDTGCGIRQDGLEKLFKKFSQVHSEGSHRQIGTGLGLWISKSLAEFMGGNIHVFSKPNIGTCFVVIVCAKISPIVENTSERTERNWSVSPSFLKEKGKRKILLADDDPYNLDVHKQLLKNAGWENIVTATNGRELVSLFERDKSETFSGIITDVNMPILDGISAAKLIREIESKRRAQKRVKIGFITGHSNNKDKLICEQSPINAWFYLSKPVTAAMLEGYLQSNSISGNSMLVRQELDTRREKFVVLCVDDDLFNLEMLEGLLAEFKPIVLKAHSGKQALEIAENEIKEKRRIDLVLVDCNMPEIDGWMTSQKIYELTQKNDLHNSPLIMILSGDKLSDNESRLRKCGIEGWIQKPIHREDLSKIFIKLAAKAR